MTRRRSSTGSDPSGEPSTSAAGSRKSTMRAVSRADRSVGFDRAAARPIIATTADHPNAEALIRVHRVGLTRMDVQIARGLFEFQGILGRAFVGTVEEINGVETNRRTLMGRRVVGFGAIGCSACDLCRAGLSTLCRKAVMPGARGCDGALAEWIALPVRGLAAVPDSVDDDHAVFALPLAAAVQAARQIRIEGKPYITVLGDGPLGLLCAQVMSKRNASVRVLGRFSEKLNLCAKWGIRHRHVDDVGRRADQDVVIDCTGDPSGLEAALSLVRPRGTIVLKSFCDDAACEVKGRSTDLTAVVWGEVEIIGSFHGPLAEALELLRRREVDVVSLITRRTRLDDAIAGLEYAARPETLSVVVEV